MEQHTVGGIDVSVILGRFDDSELNLVVKSQDIPLGITPGALITFTPNSEFEFIIEGERLYCMKSNDIALTHEYQGNEEENNPSWAKSD